MISRIHELKTAPKYFEKVVSGNKTFEVRKHDRDFKIADILKLREWEEGDDFYTGREYEVVITYILPSTEFQGIAPGYSVLGIYPINESRQLLNSCKLLHPYKKMIEGE